MNDKNSDNNAKHMNNENSDNNAKHVNDEKHSMGCIKTQMRKEII